MRLYPAYRRNYYSLYARRYSYRFLDPEPSPAPSPVPEPQVVPAVEEFRRLPEPYIVVPYSTTVVKAVPAAATSSQYHAQDEFGNVAYGYKNPNSYKEEKRDAYGNVVGTYAYIDETGVQKHLSYVADDFGFRVTSTNALPVAAPH